MLNDFDEINAILAGMRDDGTIEPIDSAAEHVDFWDWADVIGIADEFGPEEMVDEHGEVWYVS